MGKRVPHRAYRPIRNDIDILLSAPRRFYEMLLKSPNVWVLVLGFPSLKFSETGRRGGQESRFPSASSGQALTGYCPIRNDIDILLLALRRFYEMLLKSPDVLGFSSCFPSLGFILGDRVA